MKSKIRIPHFISLVKDIKNTLQNRNSQMLFASMACAFVFSFVIIGIGRTEINGNSMMASVANLQGKSLQKVDFDADVALFQGENNFRLIAGKNMQKVDFIEGVIALNPTLGAELSFSENMQMITESDGMYRFKIEISGRDISAGEEIAVVVKNTEKNIPVTLIDTQFVSSGERYNLSNIVE